MFQTTITNTRVSERIVSEQESFSWLEIFWYGKSRSVEGEGGEGKKRNYFLSFPGI